jgi:hypothetical protein
VIDDEPDVGDLFGQRSRHEWRQCTYLMHFAASGETLSTLKAGVRHLG